MSIKREAGYHEAGHIVVAHFSRFHAPIGDIKLSSYGAGAASISLSRRKLTAAGKPPDSSSQIDPEVAEDLAVILVAGFVAEVIAAEKDNTLVPNKSCAAPDHEFNRQQLSNAGLSKKFDRHEERAREILEEQWPLVDRLAAVLFEKGGMTFDDVFEFLERVSS